MPKVPLYDGPQVRLAGGSNARVEQNVAPAVAGKDMQGLGQALQGAGKEAGDIYTDMAQQANDTRVRDAQNQFDSVRNELMASALQVEGKNALDRDGKALSDDYGDTLDEKSGQILNQLGNDAQKRAFREYTAAQGVAFRGRVTGHMIEQQGKYRDDVDNETIRQKASQGASFWGDKAMLDESVAGITATIDNMAARHGWDDTVKAGAFSQAVSPMHEGVMQSMVSAGKADLALAYYTEHAGSMTLESRKRMHDMAMRAADDQKSEGAAALVWQSMGPKGPNAAVNIFDMEAEVDKQLDGSAAKVAKGYLREYAAAYRSQQADAANANHAAVLGMYDDGKPLGAIRKSAAFQALPGDVRAQVDDYMTRNRESAVDDELSRLKKADDLLFRKNYETYLTAISPEYLDKATLGQVEALRIRIGNDGMMDVRSRWVSYHKDGKKDEVRIDDETFKAVANDVFGIDTYASTTGAFEKERMAYVRRRVEAALKAHPEVTKLSDRRRLMEEAAARAVEVEEPGFNPSKPLLLLTPDELSRVVVPDDQRQKIGIALRKARESDPKNSSDPALAGTEENIRRLYLQSLSAGELEIIGNE